MTKKTFISTLLLFIFSIVLVHNVIPHHHHDEVSKINNHEHKHHHDEKEQNHHKENNGPMGLFSHSSNILVSTDFTISISKKIQKTQNVKHFFQITDLDLEPVIIPIKRKPPNYVSVIPLQLYSSSYSLRGPPEV